MKKGDIVTVMTISGEFVGKIQSDDNLLVLDDPRLVVQGPEGQMGFARGICQTGVENPTKVLQVLSFLNNGLRPVRSTTDLSLIHI